MTLPKYSSIFIFFVELKDMSRQQKCNKWYTIAIFSIVYRKVGILNIRVYFLHNKGSVENGFKKRNMFFKELWIKGSVKKTNKGS